MTRTKSGAGFTAKKAMVLLFFLAIGPTLPLPADEAGAHLTPP